MMLRDALPRCTLMASDSALRLSALGLLLRIDFGELTVDIAPEAGGRLAQVVFEGVDWLVGHDAEHAATIAWGNFPMLPWAGRLRHGKFDFRGHRYQLPLDLGAHATHGVGFALPWQVEEHTPTRAVLALQLPEDTRWPFGGSARHSIEVSERRLRLRLTLRASAQAMPAMLGWHPWFLKPDALDFRPDHYYPRDAEGIAHLPLREPPPGPWDDCFHNREPVLLRRGGKSLRLISDCKHWVIYDEPVHATCIEPQSGPPDAFNLGLARILEPGDMLSTEFLWEW